MIKVLGNQSLFGGTPLKLMEDSRKITPSHAFFQGKDFWQVDLGLDLSADNLFLFNTS
jgi:hypothetical protein